MVPVRRQRSLPQSLKAFTPFADAGREQQKVLLEQLIIRMCVNISLPIRKSDSEFEDIFVDYYDEFIKGLPDLTKASQLMGVLCDNVYRRIKDDTCPAHINVTIDNAGNLMRVSQVHLDSGAFTPKSVTAGEFTIFAKTGPATIHRLSTIIPHTDFVGKYVMQKRSLSPAEQALVPVLPAWYIIPQEVVDICKHAQHTTGKAAQMRNFMLRGPAGTGKTMGARAIAAGLGLPYMKYTCSAGTEIYDCATRFYTMKQEKVIFIV